MGKMRPVTVYWKEDDPRIDFLLNHLDISSVESLFSDLIADNIDVWVDEHSGGNDECDLDDSSRPTAAIPSSQLEPELRWTPDIDDNRPIASNEVDPSNYSRGGDTDA